MMSSNAGLVTGVVLFLLAGCTNYPSNAAYNEAKARIIDEMQASSVEEWRPSMWNQIDKLTNALMANMGDSIADDEREDLQEIVHGHFVEDTRIRQSMSKIYRDEMDPKIRSNLLYSHRSLRMDVVDNTQNQVQQLLDADGYGDFKRALKPFLPREVIRRSGNNFRSNPGAGSSWSDSGYMPPMDGSSRWDGRGGP